MVALSISRWRSMQNFAPDGRSLTILHGPVESRLRLRPPSRVAHVPGRRGLFAPALDITPFRLFV
ncbi:hypothetical protein CQ13_35555 [Bradyrhizobium retamae]|uniref:Uncharacterized protein n=1 Tax=Bradyrhizobium retamae TaxID=1300035 RepID=A0A0R3MCN0_9BRAD|nr:hypothetical protein CQ13_35555 [Bradyrhizobium retamae]